MIQHPANPGNTVKLKYNPLLNVSEKKFKNLSILIIHIKKYFLKRREYKKGGNLIPHLARKSDLSKRNVAILIE